MFKNSLFRFILLMLIVVYLIIYSLNSYNNIHFIYISSVVLYVILNVQYIWKYLKGHIVSFELFFSISFFLSCLLFSLLFDLISYRQDFISSLFMFSERSQMRFFSISLVGYYAYMYGLIPSDSSSNSYELSGRCYISPSLRKLSDIFTLFFLLLFVIQGGLDILNRYKVDDYNFSSYANSLFYLVLFYTISSMCNIMLVPDLNKDAIKKTIKSLSNLYIFNSIIILLLFLISGARSQLLQIALPIFFLYFSYIKKVKNKYIIFGIILGLVLMSIIGFVRMGESFASTNVGIVDYLRDFIFENAAGIWLVDYSDSYGITYGSNAILQIVSFIPFAQSFLLFFIDKSSIAESSSILYTFSIRDDGSGMGTNIIGDLYYTFGPIGVVVLMFLMGFVIRKLSRDRSTYGLLALIVLIGNAIFSTRVEFFYIIRMVGFSLIIFWILKKIPRLAKK